MSLSRTVDRGFGNVVASRLDRKGFHVISPRLTEKGGSDLKAVASLRLNTVLFRGWIGCQSEAGTGRDKNEIGVVDYLATLLTDP